MRGTECTLSSAEFRPTRSFCGSSCTCVACVGFPGVLDFQWAMFWRIGKKRLAKRGYVDMKTLEGATFRQPAVDAISFHLMSLLNFVCSDIHNVIVVLMIDKFHSSFLRNARQVAKRGYVVMNTWERPTFRQQSHSISCLF